MVSWASAHLGVPLTPRLPMAQMEGNAHVTYQGELFIGRQFGVDIIVQDSKVEGKLDREHAAYFPYLSFFWFYRQRCRVEKIAPRALGCAWRGIRRCLDLDGHSLFTTKTDNQH